MAYEFKLPPLSENTEEGVVVAWFKREGSHVTEGEPLLEVQMEKVGFDVPAPVSGTLVEILARKDDIVATGQVIARIETEATQSDETPDEAPPRTAEAEDADRAPAPVRASPRAKRLAREHGIELETVDGTGRDGRITEEDVQRAIEGAGGEAEAAPIPIRGMRATIARRMQQSQQQTAPVTLFTEADVTDLVERRRALKAAGDVSYTDLVLKAAARALREHPRLNATATEETIQPHRSIHIGLAVAVDEGLQVPVIRDVDAKSLHEIAAARQEAAEKARAGTLSAQELDGGTFSVTNLGPYDVDGFTPIINPPQVSILGVGRIAPRLALRDGQVVERAAMTLSLTFDHRVVDGAPAAAFLQTLKRQLEAPDWAT